MTHPTVAAFGRESSWLTIGGIRLDRLTERVGGTPFFAYDRGLLTARVAQLRTHLPPGVELSYPIRANPMPAVVWHASSLVDAFSVGSAAELQTALDTPMPSERVNFAGPGKTTAEIIQAVAAGVIIELESETEANRVVEIGEKLSLRPRVAVRINPDFQIKGSGMRLGGGSQQFGVDSERIPFLIRWLTETDVELVGFHVCVSSQSLGADLLAEAQRRAVTLVLKLVEETSVPLGYLNLGGGFGIPYFARDEPLDLPAIGANLASLLDRRLRPQFPAARVVVELGRYLVGECGIYVTRVLDRKSSRGMTFLVVDGGLHHQLAASGNLGQVIRRNYPLAVANRIDDPATEQATVVGRLTTPLDLLGDRVPLPRAEIGDLVVVFAAGAYGRTASPTAFLSHPAPVEVLV